MLAGSALGLSAPAAHSVDYFAASTTQSPPNPVPAGALVTYTTTVTNISGEAHPFSWLLPGEEAVVNMFVVRQGTHRAPPNTYISITPSQGTCTPDATTPPSFICTLGSLAPGQSVTYVSTIEAQVSMDNLVAVLRLGPTVSADVTTIVEEAATSVPDVTATCVVPDLVGRRIRAARRLLRDANCSVGTVTRKRVGRRKRKRVLSQEPPAGTVLPDGTPVAVVVGKR